MKWMSIVAVIATLASCGRSTPQESEACEVKGERMTHPDPTKPDAVLQCSKCDEPAGCRWVCYGPPGACGEQA